MINMIVAHTDQMACLLTVRHASMNLPKVPALEKRLQVNFNFNRVLAWE